MLPKQSVSAGAMSKVLLMGVVLKLAGATAAMPGRNVSFLHNRMVFMRLHLRLTPFTFIFCVFQTSQLRSMLFHVLCMQELRVQFVLAPSALQKVADGQQDRNIARPTRAAQFHKTF